MTAADRSRFRLLKADEAQTIEALGETLVPGARAAGVAHFVDQQLSVPPEEALLEARILNVRPPYANFYRAAVDTLDNASRTLNGGRKFAQALSRQLHQACVESQGTPYVHAAATASCHCAVASARKIRSVDREMRWRKNIDLASISMAV